MFFDAPRGKWLCYYCKVVRVGVDLEHTVTPLAGEGRPLGGLESLTGWRQTALAIGRILQGYPCAKSYRFDELLSTDFKNWEDFVSSVMKKVPSDGGKNAFYVLKLFEAIVESEVVFA